MALIFRLALRNIFRNVRRTLLTVSLIASGIAALIFTDGMMIGMTDLFIGKITGIWLGQAQVHEPGFRETLDVDFYIKNPQAIVDRLRADPDVAGVVQRTMSGGMIASSNNVAPGAVIGVEPEHEKLVSKLRDALVDGTYLSADSTSDIMIGYKMADLLEVEMGDRIVVTVAEAETGEMSQALFRVSAFLRFNDRAMDQEMAFVSLSEGQKLLGLGQGVHEIALRFVDGADQAVALERLKASMEPGGPELLGWEKLAPDLSAMLEIYDFSIYIIGAILFFLISFGLVNSMYMSIYERHYEFGVMLGLGTRARKLFLLVCCEGLLIGILGSIVGLVAGGLINYWTSIVGIGFSGAEFAGISLNEPIKTMMRIQQFTIIPLYIIVLTVLACIMPALHGARLRPADALRRAL